MRAKAQEIPQEELAFQRECMARVRDLPGRPRTFCIVTYGCQMNVRDSETLTGMLREMGITEAAQREEADLVIFNTCCVRDNAERRALGNVTWLNTVKKERPGMLVAVCGCMMQEPGMGERILRQYPFVDLAFGTHNLYRLPLLLETRLQSGRQTVEVLGDDAGCIPEGLPVVRSSPYSAYINIMYGCNNFCSYCIVPYVRGRERSRRSENILEEARQLLDEGVQEITLLGQNVNSYGLDREEELRFAGLLSKLDQLGVPRIRFMTSHPKDLSDELIAVMAGARHICPALHLPLQHGSNRILESMNRRYTRESYLERVSRLRAAIPDISLTTDLIVGYPGETEEDFALLCDTVRQVRYDSAFTFIYSPRTGTRAAQMSGQIPPEVSSRRIQELIALQKEITAGNFARYVGQVHQVLVEGPSRRDSRQMTGKNEYNISVNFDADADLIGSIVPVRITQTRETTLRGELV